MRRAPVAALFAVAFGCGAPAVPPVAPTAAATVPGSAAAPVRPDPDLDRLPRPKLVDVDWAHVKLQADADALALWAKIAPTGDDWENKLFEVPAGPISRALALALLREGNFRCVAPAPPPANLCPAPLEDEPDPAPAATLADPCLRRELALWSIDQIETADLATIRDALPAIVALPPPESQLVAGILEKDVDNPDQSARLALLARAWQAGQRAIVDGLLGGFDEQHLIEAVQKDHIDGALDVLSGSADREVYRAAILDDNLPAGVRIRAINELAGDADDAGAGPFPKDLRETLVAATKLGDCAIAAAAIRALVTRGVKDGVPGKGPATMRTLCLVAAYEQLQPAGELSPLAGFVPAKGLALVRVGRDAYAETDQPARTLDLIPRDAIAFPELDDAVKAFGHCTGTTCSSADRDFKFTLKNGQLTQLEIDERPPCSGP